MVVALSKLSRPITIKTSVPGLMLRELMPIDREIKAFLELMRAHPETSTYWPQKGIELTTEQKACQYFSKRDTACLMFGVWVNGYTHNWEVLVGAQSLYKPTEIELFEYERKLWHMEKIVDIGGIIHRDYRGIGYGTAVRNAIAAFAITIGKRYVRGQSREDGHVRNDLLRAGYVKGSVLTFISPHNGRPVSFRTYYYPEIPCC